MQNEEQSAVSISAPNSVVELDLSLIPLVQDYLQGASIEKCATKYNIGVSEVNAFLGRAEVKRYISAELKNVGYTNKQRRLQLLTDIVDEKIKLAEENEMPLSNVDITKVLAMLRDEENDLSKLAGDVEENSGKAAYIQIINQLKMDN